MVLYSKDIQHCKMEIVGVIWNVNPSSFASTAATKNTCRKVVDSWKLLNTCWPRKQWGYNRESRFQLPQPGSCLKFLLGELCTSSTCYMTIFTFKWKNVGTCNFAKVEKTRRFKLSRIFVLCAYLTASLSITWFFPDFPKWRMLMVSVKISYLFSYISVIK